MRVAGTTWPRLRRTRAHCACAHTSDTAEASQCIRWRGAVVQRAAGAAAELGLAGRGGAASAWVIEPAATGAGATSQPLEALDMLDMLSCSSRSSTAASCGGGGGASALGVANEATGSGMSTGSACARSAVCWSGTNSMAGLALAEPCSFSKLVSRRCRFLTGCVPAPASTDSKIAHRKWAEPAALRWASACATMPWIAALN